MHIPKEKKPVPRVVVPIQNLIKKRNRELGELIRQRRIEKQASAATCASLLGISRRRYAAMEEGDATIGYAELQVLLDFLGVNLLRRFYLPLDEGGEPTEDNMGLALAPHEIRPEQSGQSPLIREANLRQIELKAQVGEVLQIVVEIVDVEAVALASKKSISMIVKL